MSSEAVLVDRQGAVGIMTLNRPETLNRLDLSMLHAIEAAFSQLEHDDAVRVIVITGAGERAFCAGGDIEELKTRGGLAHYRQFGETIQRLFARIEDADKPTVAAVNGWALGGGTELLLSIDLRIVAEEARLGLPEINLGLFPGAGGSQRLMRQVPLCKAKELMFVGDQLSAAEALALGLCNRIVPRAQLLAETLALAARIAQKSPLTLKLLKRSMRQGLDMPLGAALHYEQAMVSLAFDTQDVQEGCSAFLDKRAAKFTGD
jgi:enoyl-CoA hydratase